MLRNRIVNGQKASDATYEAHAALKRGMGVVKSTGGDTAFPDAATDAGIFVVDRDNIPTGVNCAYTDRPDSYFDDIASGEKLILVAYDSGESFYTNQYDDDAIVDGTKIGVGIDGKWEAYVTGTKYVSRGTKTVAGTTMLIVDVIA